MSRAVALGDELVDRRVVRLRPGRGRGGSEEGRGRSETGPGRVREGSSSPRPHLPRGDHQGGEAALALRVQLHALHLQQLVDQTRLPASRRPGRGRGLRVLIHQGTLRRIIRPSMAVISQGRGRGSRALVRPGEPKRIRKRGCARNMRYKKRNAHDTAEFHEIQSTKLAISDRDEEVGVSIKTTSRMAS